MHGLQQQTMSILQQSVCSPVSLCSCMNWSFSFGTRPFQYKLGPLRGLEFSMSRMQISM